MESGSKKRLLVFVAILVVLLGGWWYLGFSFDVSRFFAAEPTSVPLVTATMPPQPTIPPIPAGAVRCAPATQTVKVGAKATLTATGGDGLYLWGALNATAESAKEISNATGVSMIGDATTPFTISYATPGTKKVLVDGTRSNTGPQDPNSGYGDSVACTVIVTP